MMNQATIDVLKAFVDYQEHDAIVRFDIDQFREVFMDDTVDWDLVYILLPLIEPIKEL